jgi:hypothetical protein
MSLIFIILYLLSFPLFADDECKFFKFCGSSSGRSSNSSPSQAASGNLNPSNISEVKGLGLETIYQLSNPISYGFVTGTGKVGALVSTTLENSFFGNRSIEIDDVNYSRNVNKKQYKNTKFSLGIGAKLFERKIFSLSVGLSAKRNPDVRVINPGAGVSLKIGILRLGTYFYNDDIKINLSNYVNPSTLVPYSTTYNSSTYEERFHVATFTAGIKYKDFTLDYGIIKTKYNFYPDNTLITLYSTSYTYKKLTLNLSYRDEI